MLQLALLTWALYFWLRYVRGAGGRDLSAYPPFVDRLRTTHQGHPFIRSVLNVPGLYAFAVDPGEMAEALDLVRGGRTGR